MLTKRSTLGGGALLGLGLLFIGLTVLFGYALRGWRLGTNRTWEPDAANDRALGEARVAAVLVDGEPLAPGQRLVFLADGFGVPFRVTLDVRGIRRVIEGDAAGSIVVAAR